ncbi:MAG: SdpI family protein [Candidatus Peribacteraceae bacterium]|nr:SdpI family protein [Candidatus Peribacteraceae bacterium]
METPLPSRIVTPLAALKVLIVAGMFAAGALLYSRLPEQIPSHWNFAGQVDDFTAKPWGVWMLPLVALAMAVLFPLFRRIDPRRENYEMFRHSWDMLQLCFVAFMAYIYGMQLYLSLQPLPSPDFVGRFVTFGIGMLFVVIGNYMGKIRQNFFVGMRTPWTLSDPEVWRKSQRFGGWAFVLGGLAVIAESVIWWRPEFIFFGIVLIVAFLPMFYSFVIYPRNKTATGKGMRSFLLLALVTFLVGAAVAVGIRLTSSEDTWLCDKGQWVKHGSPSAPMPTEPCI